MRTESAVERKILKISSLSSTTDKNLIISRARSVLGIYRDVVWATKRKATDLKTEAFARGSQDIETGLVYLSDFAPIDEQKDFEDRVNGLFKNKWFVFLMENTLESIKEYPEYGTLYYNILWLSYFDNEPHKEQELLSKLSIERSAFYGRKREALLLFAIQLWGVEIPQLRNDIRR